MSRIAWSPYYVLYNELNIKSPICLTVSFSSMSVSLFLTTRDSKFIFSSPVEVGYLFKSQSWPKSIIQLMIKFPRYYLCCLCLRAKCSSWVCLSVSLPVSQRHIVSLCWSWETEVRNSRGVSPCLTLEQETPCAGVGWLAAWPGEGGGRQPPPCPSGTGTPACWCSSGTLTSTVSQGQESGR